MFEGQEKYFDDQNPEDVLQAALLDPDGSSQLLERVSTLNWEILDLEEQWEALNKREEKAVERLEKLRQRSESVEQQGKRAEAEDDADHARADREALEERLEAARRRRNVEQRTYDDLMSRVEEVGKQLEELTDFFQEQLLNKPLRDKVQKWVKPMSKEELYNLHFETLKRNKAAPSRKVVLERINNELNRRESLDDIKRRDRQDMEGKGAIPGPTKRTEQEEDLNETYLEARRGAQGLEGPDLRKRWAKSADVVEGEGASLKDFLLYKAYANEFMARYRIEERGRLDSL